MAVDLKKLKDLSEYLDGYRMGTFQYDYVIALMELRGNADLIKHHKCKDFWQLMDKTGVGSRRARYLIQTVERLRELKYTDDEMRELFDAFRWTKLRHLANRIPKRMAVSTLIKKFSGLKVTEIAREKKVMFTANITKQQHAKLLRLLKKKYGLTAKGKGVGFVGKALGNMIDAAYKKA